MLALHSPPVEGRCPWMSLFFWDFDRQRGSPGLWGIWGVHILWVDCPVSHRQAKMARVQATLMFHVPCGGGGRTGHCITLIFSCPKNINIWGTIWDPKVLLNTPNQNFYVRNPFQMKLFYFYVLKMDKIRLTWQLLWVQILDTFLMWIIRNIWWYRKHISGPSCGCWFLSSGKEILWVPIVGWMDGWSVSSWKKV